MLLLTSLIVAGQLCAMAIFLWFIQGPRIDYVAALEASQIVLLEHVLSTMPESARRDQLAALHGVAEDAPALPPAAPLEIHSYWLRRYLSTLLARLPANIEVRWDGRANTKQLWVRLTAPLGTPPRHYWIALQAAPMEASFVLVSVLCLLLTLASFPTLGAYLIDRRIDGPLKRLARAAAGIERGERPAPVAIGGPAELATVAVAFNHMAAALAAMEAQRAEMLAGISHDIRTPLTKLRMAIAAPESIDAPVASAERFVEEIDAIVQQFIDFARGADDEAAVDCDLNEMVGQLAADYVGLGTVFSLELQALPPLVLRPVSMQRLLMNLMQNAVRYGGTALSVRSAVRHDMVMLAVEDRGPGVPAETLALLTQPFRRGVHADAQGGAGLGLAIADRIARQSGGRLELRLRRSGGFSAMLWLPLPDAIAVHGRVT